MDSRTVGALGMTAGLAKASLKLWPRELLLPRPPFLSNASLPAVSATRSPEASHQPILSLSTAMGFPLTALISLQGSSASVPMPI